MASRRDRLTGNTSTTTAPTRSRPKRKSQHSNKPKKSRASSTTNSTAGSSNTSTGPYNEDAVGTSDGPYDPNATYGRTPTNPNIGTYEEWLAAEGYGNKGSLNKNRRNRLKEQYALAKGPEGEFAETDAGEQLSNEDPDQYYNWLMGEAGGMTGSIPQYGGPTAFGQFLANDYRGYVDQGFDAANMQSGGHLNFADYMSSIGWAPNQQQSTLLGAGAAPRDTGNPFTSTSMPQPASTSGVGTPPANTPSATGTNNSFLSSLRNTFPGLKPSSSSGNSVAQQLLAPFKAPTLPDVPAVDGLASARKMFNALTPQQRGINGSTANRSGRWAVYG